MEIIKILVAIGASIVMLATVLEPVYDKTKQFDFVKFAGWMCTFIWCLQA